VVAGRGAAAAAYEDVAAVTHPGEVEVAAAGGGGVEVEGPNEAPLLDVGGGGGPSPGAPCDASEGSAPDPFDLALSRSNALEGVDAVAALVSRRTLKESPEPGWLGANPTPTPWGFFFLWFLRSAMASSTYTQRYALVFDTNLLGHANARWDTRALAPRRNARVVSYSGVERRHSKEEISRQRRSQRGE
jgi:hypothetical protein